jgi:hypothetical protein
VCLAGFPTQLSGLFSSFSYSAVQVIGSWHQDVKAMRSSPVVLSCSALPMVMFQRNLESVEQGPREENTGGNKHDSKE